MAPAERIEEVAFHLATGYLRVRHVRIALDLSPRTAALHVVLNGRDEAPRKEPA
jgi:hypothetical protein